MPPTRALARYSLFAALLVAAAGASVRAQDAEPEAPAAEEAVKPRAKPKPKPKPAPKAAPTQAAPAAAPAALWPAGASSVSESYGDWTMSCTRPNDRPACVVVQSQGDSKTGRRHFGIELRVPREGRADGIILMPFGLAIEPGVTFKLDDQVLGKGAPYTACNGDGCLVPISLPTLATDGMRAAKNLYVTGQKSATGGGTGEPTTITVPLVGFPQALDRAAALSG
jgi:invasion protein IalB